MSKNLNLIERCFEVFVRNQQKIGMGSDEVSYVAGFMACFGVLSGRLPLPGLGDNVTVLQRFESVEKELQGMRNTAIGAYQDNQRNGG